jgi:hypothetical protein
MFVRCFQPSSFFSFSLFLSLSLSDWFEVDTLCDRCSPTPTPLKHLIWQLGLQRPWRSVVPRYHAAHIQLSHYNLAHPATICVEFAVHSPWTRLDFGFFFRCFFYFCFLFLTDILQTSAAGCHVQSTQ